MPAEEHLRGTSRPSRRRRPATAGILALAFVVVAPLAIPALGPIRTLPWALPFLVAAAGNRRVLFSVWFIALPAAGFGTLNVLGPLRLDELGLSAVAIGAVWLVSAGCEAALSPIVGHVSDQRGRLVPLRVGLASAAAVFAVTTGAPVASAANTAVAMARDACTAATTAPARA